MGADVMERLRRFPVRLRVARELQDPGIPERDAQPLILRPYQNDCITALRESYTSGHKAPLLALPTGGGKTLVFASITVSARGKGKRVLVVVHRRELLKQASAKLTWSGVPHGIIAAGFKPDPEQFVQVASIQTIIRRLHNVAEFDLIVFDEAHHCQAATWRKLIKAQPKAKLLGVTATPCRADGKGLGTEDGGCFDDLVVGPSIAELVSDGYLSLTRTFVPEHRIDMRGVRTQAGDYVANDLAKVVDTSSITGDAVEQYTKRADHKPAIAFCATVAHAEHVAEAFRAAGYKSVCVHGGTPKEERDAAIAGLGSGEVEVLTSCDLISEGLDVPVVSAVILLRPTKSFGLHMQQVGRGMRPAPGKVALIVNDHVGNSIEHGLPTSQRRWTLKGVEKKPGTVLQWRCPECGCINDMAALFCVSCEEPRPQGIRGPMKVVEGSLRSSPTISSPLCGRCRTTNSSANHDQRPSCTSSRAPEAMPLGGCGTDSGNRRSLRLALGRRWHDARHIYGRRAESWVALSLKP